MTDFGTGGGASPADGEIEATQTMVSGSSGQDSEPPVVALAPGTRVHHYEIIRELGRGGMGAVYLARDTKLGRRVAMKFLNSRKPDLARRFLDEARLTARCVHENIVEIHDVDQYDDIPYMVLEYLSGEPMAKLLTGTPLPPQRAVELIVPVVRALACAHGQGIVHRDLKPDNILITDAGTIKVVDFGIAKLLSTHSETARVTFRLDGDKPAFSTTDLHNHTSGIGTVPFMSPEQWGADDIDHRSDIWAVGIILHIMVTGRHPLAPLRAERLASTALLEDPMPRVQGAGVPVPEELARVIDQCLIKHKAERMPGAAELLAALEPFLPGRHGRRASDEHSPYPGLSAFQEADADRFFGRGRDIATVTGRLREQPMIGVVGPSGAGKSSFVRAGVIPALKRSGESWEAVVMRPGRHPLASLAQVILPIAVASTDAPAEDDDAHGVLTRRLRAEPGYLGLVLRKRARAGKHHIVVFVDQFEELYTLAADADERAAFTAALLGVADDAAAPLRVVLSIRSDFLDRAAEDRRFMAELTRGLCFLPLPDRTGLRDALVQPLELLGYRFSTDDMVEHMLDALDGTPGALPLLQFTAGVLWDMRDRAGRQLTGASYARIGGVAGALAGHADAVLRGLPTHQQRLARAVFRRLVTPERTRDLVELGELRTLASEPDDIEQVVRYFVDARLLVIHQGEGSDSPLCEIVHESLITRWPALKRWLDEDQEAVAFLADLRAAARQWHARERSPGMLWRGDAVDTARRWREHCAGDMSAIEREYLDAVFALADRAVRVRRRVIAAVMTLLVVLVAAAVVALVAIRDAERRARAEAARAREAERVAKEQHQTIRDQLVALQAEKEATAVAERKAREASDVTELTRQELIDALASARDAQAVAERESQRAQDEARKARAASEEARRAHDAEKRTNERLQELVRERDARIKKLEKETGGVADGPLR